MKIHEYEAKALLARYGVPVPRGEAAMTAKEAEAAAKRIGGSVVHTRAKSGYRRPFFKHSTREKTVQRPQFQIRLA